MQQAGLHTWQGWQQGSGEKWWQSGYTSHPCGNMIITATIAFWYLHVSWRVSLVGCKDKCLLLSETAEALYCLHKHENQVMIGTPHLRSKLLPTVWQLREITGKKTKNLEWNTTAHVYVYIIPPVSETDIYKSMNWRHFPRMYLVKSFWHASSSCKNRMQGAWKRCGFPRERKHCWTISRTLHTLKAWALFSDRVCRILQEEESDYLTMSWHIFIETKSKIEGQRSPTLLL